MSINIKDLVKVIKACRVSGVEALKVDGLELRFTSGDAGKSLGISGDTARPPTQTELADVEDRVKKTEILDQADEHLFHLQVEDPAEFERMLIQRELEPSGEGAEEITLD